MSKFDLFDVFRYILVRRENWELFGFIWFIDINGIVIIVYFVDVFLFFGLRSFFAFFFKYVDILSFIMRDRGVRFVWNYLDDFWICGFFVLDFFC